VARKDDDILAEIRERFEISSSAETENRATALESIRFTDGKQWDEADLNERKQQRRPALQVNKTRITVNRVVGDILQNLPSMKVIPVENGDFAGAQVRNEMVRHIERMSNAQDVYGLAAKQAVNGGYGYFRILTKHVDDETFDQDIIIKGIKNRFTVYMDQTAEEYTYEDARYAIITEVVPKDDFEREHPTAEAVDIMGNVGNLGERYEKWYEPDTVRIAEYFWKEPVTKTIADIVHPSGQQKTIELTDEVGKELTKNGWLINRTRKSKSHKVMWAKVTGHEILDGPREFPSKYIPIVPVLGYEENEEGKRQYRSLIHDTKDSQKILNFFYTAEVEQVQQQAKAPWLGTAKMFEGNEGMWRNANTIPYSALIAKPDPRVPGGMPQRIEPPRSSQGHLNHIQLADADMKDTSGIQDAALGKTSNERSGRAILARQRGSDITTITFRDNLLKSVRFAGKIILDMLPRVYDNRRVIRVLGRDGQLVPLALNFPTLDPGTLEPIMVNDLSEGKFDYIADAGAMFMTKRQEAVAALLQTLQFAPFYAPVLAPKIIEMSDIPDAIQLANELKALAQQQAQAESANAQGGSPPSATPTAESVPALPAA
jgi:hypothetical protein